MKLGTNWKGGGGGGGGANHPPLVLNESCLYSSIFGSKLEFRVSYKGGNETEPPFGSFKNERNEMDLLMNHKEA